MNYSDLRAPQLRHMAQSGDAEAAREIARRASTAAPAPDVTALPYADLANLRRAWADGETADQRAHSLALALAAHVEMTCRRAVVEHRGVPAGETGYYGPEPGTVPGLPGVAPWEVPPPPRCRGWKRPTSSTHYRSDEDIARERLGAMAREHYRSERERERAAGVPREE